MAFRRISPKEASLLMAAGYTYVDVRSIPEYEASHPVGSVNIPLLHQDPARGMVPNAEFTKVVEANFAKDAKLIVGCQAGGRSYRAAEALTRAGYSDVVDQRAGFGGVRDPNTGSIVEPGWRDAGLPVESAPGQPYAALAAKAGVK